MFQNFVLETKGGMSKVEGVSKQRDNGNWAAQEGLGWQLAATPGVRSDRPWERWRPRRCRPFLNATATDEGDDLERT